jgi:transcriptional regulator with XRE-family HTH domain
MAVKIRSNERSATMGKELGSRITETLQKRGMTQKELAGRIGVTEAVMSRYVSGAREPKPDVLANIATALHTTSDFLLGIENEEFSHPRIRRMIARNASSMTEQEKRELINALFGEE